MAKSTINSRSEIALSSRYEAETGSAGWDPIGDSPERLLRIAREMDQRLLEHRQRANPN